MSDTFYVLSDNIEIAIRSSGYRKIDIDSNDLDNGYSETNGSNLFSYAVTLVNGKFGAVSWE